MSNDSPSPPLAVGMLLYPNLTQLDLTGPYEVFARMPRTRVHLIGTGPAPVRSEHGLAIVPEVDLDSAPPIDVLFVPGGPGLIDVIDDTRFIGFLRERGEQARYVTAVCTGALLLGAAGLLRGYRAATHWLSLDLLHSFGAEPVAERVVIDRNRITGSGVTAGIDVGLVIAAELYGVEVAQEIQLMIEYDPAPPFHSGSPRTAAPDLVARVRAARQPMQDARRRHIEALVEGWYV